MRTDACEAEAAVFASNHVTADTHWLSQRVGNRE